MNTKIRDAIYGIGKRLISDHSYTKYADLECNFSEGVIPRGLIYEEDNRDTNAIGCVMVGLNPGKANKEERDFFKSEPLSYERFLLYWEENVLQRPYYKRLRKLADEIELGGPVLWTELVKCQNKEKGKLSVQTIRDDINKYLFRELENIPASWPLFGIGNQAFEILSYRFPDRLVLGIPHPTGSYGLFPKLFENKKLRRDIFNYTKKILKSEEKIAVKLGKV